MSLTEDPWGMKSGVLTRALHGPMLEKTSSSCDFVLLEAVDE